MIEVKNLHKRFGKNEVLKGIDLSINEGGVFAILGPTGSGKTTLIKTILGMVIPNSGTITVNGKPLKDSFRYRSDIDYLPQLANFPGNLKVNELISMIKDHTESKTDKDKERKEVFKIQPFLVRSLANITRST